MKVDIRVKEDINEPYIVIYTNEISEEVNKIMLLLQSKEKRVITAKDREKVVILNPEEIYMASVEGDCVYIYTNKNKYSSNKRLYEFEEMLGRDFMRISKSTIINLTKLSYVEPAFNGMMKVYLKNGSKTYISRKYLPNLKRYLGL